MVKFMVIWTTALLITTVLAEHGTFRSCFQCASESSQNYICDWGNKVPGKAACCKPGSQSIYCQPSKFNKCSPTFDVAKGLFYSFCPGIDNKLCNTERKNMSLENYPTYSKQSMPVLHYFNHSDTGNFPYTAQACYYIIETPKYLYSEGTVKMEILDIKNVEVFLFAGLTKETVKAENVIATVEEDKTIYSCDFEQVLMVVVIPQQNQKNTKLDFQYKVVDMAEVDWYWKLYLENFSTPEGQKLLYVYSTCIGIIVCLFCCSICVGSYWCCCKPKVYDDPEVPGRRFSRRRSSKGTSLRATIRRSMRLESIVEKSGQSFRRKSTMHKLVNVHGSGQSPLKLISPYPPGPAKILNPDNLNDEEYQAQNRTQQVGPEYQTQNPEEQQDQSMKQLIEN